MSTYDIKVKVKTKDGNSATRTLLSGVNEVNTEAFSDLLNAYQKISTDKIDTSTGSALVTVVKNDEYAVQNITATPGQDYLSSDDVLTIQGTLGLDTKSARVSSAATYDKSTGATYTREQYMIDVKRYASKLNLTVPNWIPVTATLSQTTKDSFSADEDG